MVGLRFSRMPLNICRGMVACSGPARNRVTTTSSKEVAKANSAPEITPGAISGRVTRKNAVSGGAPRLAAARTRFWLKPCRVAVTVMITKGTPSTACTRISEM
ncbi:hypothetical protein D3C85_1307010 [compost metagenome]